MTKYIFLTSTLISLLLTACAPSLEEKRARESYAYGRRVGESLREQIEPLELDPKIVAFAIRESMLGKDNRLNTQQMENADISIRKRMRKRRDKNFGGNRQKGEAYIEAYTKKAGVKATGSGLLYRVLRRGNGRSPELTDRVTVHYKGTLIDGTVFDSSYKRKKPATFALGKVIKGWREGLQLMKEGAKYEFVIPHFLAYGDSKQQKIPPYSTLVFTVELIDVK